MKKYLALIGISCFLIMTGAFMLLSILRSQQSQQFIAAPPTHKVNQSATQADSVHGQPSELILPSLNLDLPVVPGVYNPQTKTWTLTLDKVQYASETPEPNTISGNTFIYGHYRKGVLATLHTIQPNAEAVVKTSNGHSFYYQLVNVRTTDPADASVFQYAGKPILTIQTCTGLFFQNRQLFTFNLVRAV